MDDDNYLAQQRTVKGTERPVEGDTHQVSTSQPPSHHITDAQCLPPMPNIDPADDDPTTT